MSVKMTQNDIVELQSYLRKKFTHPGLNLRAREKANDSCEVLLEGEFIGVIYKDFDEGETSFTFTMSILSEDLADE